MEYFLVSELLAKNSFESLPGAANATTSFYEVRLTVLYTKSVFQHQKGKYPVYKYTSLFMSHKARISEFNSR